MESERFEYFDLWKCVYVNDIQTDKIVYYRDGVWKEEKDMDRHQLEMNDMGLRIPEKWALEKTKGSSPLTYIESII